jgi:hypothetical protein
LGELIKQNQELELRPITEADRVRLALMLSTAARSEDGVFSTGLVEAADRMGLELAELVCLLNDPDFLKLTRSITKARANMVMNSIAIEQLTRIVRDGDEKEVLGAIKILGAWTGDMRAQHSIDINLNFNDLYNQMDERRKSGEVIDMFAIGGNGKAED